MNSNLTPEPRVNKLGHTVTKHVKPNTPTITFRSMVPAPSAGPDAYRNKLMDSIMDAISISFGYSGTPPHKLHAKLDGFSTDTLEIIGNTCAWSKQLPVPVSRVMFEILNDEDEPLIREVMSCLPFIDRDINLPAAAGVRIIAGLHHLDHFKDHEDLAVLEEHDFKTAVAFINVTAYLVQYAESESLMMSSDGTGSYHLANADLHDLIVTHPDKADQMIKIISERTTGDAALIRSYVENGTALREGAL
jgi:hypothetical protein